MDDWLRDPATIAIVIGSGASLAFLTQLIHFWYSVKDSGKRQESLTQRIDRLAGALKEATGLIADIEQQIQDRHSFVERLRVDVQRYEQLAQLNQSQVEAVAQLLRAEIRAEGRSTFWKGVVVNFLFFIIGVIVSRLAM